ncbi:DUF1249 domain-containing protein [Marinospirillum alkaliphilum]|uniref:DUF1249 domain-containing protein n=1 Tax=Marinospirillum alkaliphilum DSM 21637 TaxID=1122209 RepID=A0A1K1YF57_9GAMM|nr:DUF1249 domain-containing protein [Marinospirillum alkaliphilum]SFX60374.1 hypothetical protein SAMN02745752_02206 [Marinospirillum alkaliphilum DSM 21637]
MPRTAYVAELSRLQSDAAASYLLLQRLWQADEQQVCHIGLRQHGRDLGQLHLQRLERTPWTELIELRYSQQVDHPLLHPLQMQIRVYHDVRLAEVVSCQQQQPREGRYAYPNEAMFHPDEKVQVNAQLVEWLKFALSRGYTPHVTFEPDH